MSPLAEFLVRAAALAGLGLVWGWTLRQMKHLVDAGHDDEQGEQAWRDLRDRVRRSAR